MISLNEWMDNWINKWVMHECVCVWWVDRWVIRWEDK